MLATLARETHLNDPLPPAGLKIQISFSYSDGFGREIQKKIQAEPGPLTPGAPSVDPRWVASGWTIFNNKGKPVRQYEPFFDDTHDFRFGNQIGVSAVLFYDPAERVVATLRPNHTWEKVIFDPWRQESWDVNDTVLLDPKTDLDVADVLKRLPDSDYLPTWYAQRIGGGLGPGEQQAATKTAAHAATPTVAHFDTLGRTFLTIADNGPAGQYATRVELDIEGNQRAVVDAKDRIVMRYDYDMLGSRVHQASMEAGERWMLNDVNGKPIRSWDSRGHNFSTEYDQLRRPIHAFVQGTDPTLQPTAILFAITEYGEELSGAAALNLLTRVYRQRDGAGITTHMGKDPLTKQDEACDFKGNLLRSKRELVRDYTLVPDYTPGNPLLEPEVVTSSTFDALNRPITLIAPDGSITRPGYNEANLLETLAVNLQGAATPTLFVTNIDYDAKGQRTLIEYGNRVRTEYEYDPQTFRLFHLYTARSAADFPDDDLIPPNPPRGVQNLRYAYDPAGNITNIRDDAQQTVYYKNQVVPARNAYKYDALYRLIEATGREHIGQAATPQTSWDDKGRVNPPHPQDGKAMRNYTEIYQYDEVGNFLHLIHQAQSGNWSRDYIYQEQSLIEAGKFNNRLGGTIIQPNADQPIPETFHYDAHGNIISMPHLAAMSWDFKDQFQSADLGGGGTAFYVYDAASQRVRKTIERQNGTLQKERFYFGGYEIYREYDGNGSAALERQTLHVMDEKHRIALVETRTDMPEQLTRYQFGNHLGSSTLELDDTGQVISYEEYYPYGSTSYQTVRSGVEVSPKRYRFTSKERDEESGFYYHGARYYVPWLGKWPSADPVGIQAGFDLYEYCKNNPLRLWDPSGREPKPGTTDYEIMTRTDVQLHRYLKTLPPEDLGKVLNAATGTFKERAVQTANRAGLERVYTLPVVEIPVPGPIPPMPSTFLPPSVITIADPSGNSSYKTKVTTDLYVISTTPSGVELFKRLEIAGETVTIEPALAKGHQTTFPTDTNKPGLHQPTGSTINYDPDLVIYSAGPEGSGEPPFPLSPQEALFHEGVHALAYAEGTSQWRGNDPKGPPNTRSAETQAIGIGTYEGTYPTENSFRKDLNLSPPRGTYRRQSPTPESPPPLNLRPGYYGD